MAPDHLVDWRKIAEQVTAETDSEKLLLLVQQLTKALDEQTMSKTSNPRSDNNSQ